MQPTLRAVQPFIPLHLKAEEGAIMTFCAQRKTPSANNDGTCHLQFPCALQTLRAPQLHSVRLESTDRAQTYMDKESRPMPVNAGNLAWLLHHPCLNEVYIDASKARCSCPSPLAPCFLHSSGMARFKITIADVSNAWHLTSSCLVLSLCDHRAIWQAAIICALKHDSYPKAAVRQGDL